MKPKTLLFHALVFSLLLAGCSSTSEIGDAEAYFKGTGFHVPREFKKGTATLTSVYAWTASMLGSNLPLATWQADLDRDGQDELLVSQPANSGTGGNAYFIFNKARRGYHFLGDLWFGGLQVVSPDAQGRPRLITSSSGSSTSCRTALCFLDRNGFHEIMDRNLPCGDGAYGRDQLSKLLADPGMGKSSINEETVLQFVFGNPDTMKVSGSIQAGVRFERPFGDRFVFALEPIRYGWEIHIRESGQTNNLAQAARLDALSTPCLEGWHFRNEDNTDSGHTHSDVLMQDNRQFVFSPEVPSLRMAQMEQTNFEELWLINDRIAAFGQGELKMTRIELSPPRLHGIASILEMHFECKLTWRRKNLEALYAVRQGDTLAKIAELSGMTVEELDIINPQMAAKHAPGAQPQFQPNVNEQLLIYSPTQ